MRRALDTVAQFEQPVELDAGAEKWLAQQSRTRITRRLARPASWIVAITLAQGTHPGIEVVCREWPASTPHNHW